MEQMEIIILDTDILIDYFRGVEVSKDYIERIPVNERATTDITLMELFKGARNKEELEKRRKIHQTKYFYRASCVLFGISESSANPETLFYSEGFGFAGCFNSRRYNLS